MTSKIATDKLGDITLEVKTNIPPYSPYSTGSDWYICIEGEPEYFICSQGPGMNEQSVRELSGYIELFTKLRSELLEALDATKDQPRP